MTTNFEDIEYPSEGVSSRIRRGLLNGALFLIPLVFTSTLFNKFELPKWLVTGLILGFLSINHAFEKRSPLIPKCPNWMIIAFAGVICLQFLNIFTKNPLVWGDYLYYLLNLSGYTYFFYQDIRERGDGVFKGYARSLLVSAAIIIPIGLVQLCGYPLIKNLFSDSIKEDVASTFGNINYTGQFLGISALFFIFAMSLYKSQLAKNVFFCGIVSAVTYFSYLNTRSIIIGITLAVIWLVWRRSILTKKRLLEVVIASAIVIPLSRYVISSIPRAFADESRMTSAGIRLDMWAGTVKMILNNPFGVGIDNFNFSFVPYRTDVMLQVGDNDNILNPHNEFLAIAAESGLPASVLIFGLGIGLIFYFFKTRPIDAPAVNYFDFIVGLLIVFLVEMMFQFPLDGQWALVIGALILAYMLHSSFKAVTAPVRTASRLGLGAGIFMIYSTVIWYLPMAALLESHHLEKAKFSCEERPQEWFACNRYAQALYKTGDVIAAQRVLNDELKKQPNNWFAMGLLGQIYIETDKKGEGCELYKKVDQMFNGKSRTHNFLKENCI
jgi:hypothetical protein